MKKPVKRLLVMLALLAGIQPVGAQTLVPRYSFTNGYDGGNPRAPLLQASDGNFYGTAYRGGTSNEGTIFRITASGALTPLHSFTNSLDGNYPLSSDGAYPEAGLVQASDGNLYGTTSQGGTNADGTVFRLTTNGVFTTLYSFTDGRDGALPNAGLVQASDGNLYGTTSRGGTNAFGAVFRLTTNGVFTTLYSFTNSLDGALPNAGLVQAGDGNLYGTTEIGGTNNDGAVFRITTNGVFTSLYSFTGSNDGATPCAGLVQAGDGNLYGTTYYGPNGYGTVFQITTNGVLTPLYSFTNGSDGSYPEASLMLAGDGSLYGTTSAGGTNNDGVIFQITTSGALTPLYSFTGENGIGPIAGLVQGSDGNAYGTTPGGGSYGYGTVFELILPHPTLSISPDGGQSILSWLGSNTNYVLQSTTNLASPNWVFVSNVIPASVGTVTVTNSLPAQFFRLAVP